MSREEDLNLRPIVYETIALPLSYPGIKGVGATLHFAKPLLYQLSLRWQAGERSRTAVYSLGRNHNGRYTTPAFYLKNSRIFCQRLFSFPVSVSCSWISILLIATTSSPGFLSPNLSLASSSR